jgi:DNA-binding MurR/RpiR family transcriptional regulator
VGHLPRTDGTRPSRPASSASSTTPASGSVRSSLSILIRVRGAQPSLRPAEQRVAEAVLADPAGVCERSITSLARLCRTSETTVLRFCRALGLAGYPELRIALARAAQGEEDDRAHGTPLDTVITESDSLADVVSKITYADQRAIADTGAAVDVEALQAAVDAVARARRVDVYGVGASALVGQDLHTKLHRIGVASCAWADPHGALASAAGLASGDVAIGISHTGTTTDVLDALRVARTRGATTVAITNFDRAPIVGVSDVVLTTAARETTFRTGAMSSRVSQLVLVDCLFTGVALRSYDRSVSALDSARSVLRARHVERHDRPPAVSRPAFGRAEGLSVQA